MMLVILFSLKTMGSLENELQVHSGVTPLFSMRTEMPALLQSCHSMDTNTWCKRAHILESCVTTSLHSKTGLQSAYHGIETLKGIKEWILTAKIIGPYPVFIVHLLAQLQIYFRINPQWRIQDFPRGGGANSQNCYYFSHFCRKLHENERIWTPRGGARPWRPPLDPPMTHIGQQL